MDCQKEIALLLTGPTGLSVEELLDVIELPPDPGMGDYAFPCFRLAKALRKAPPAIAAELADSLAKPAFLDEIRATGPYLNFFVNKMQYMERIMQTVYAQGGAYGQSDIGGGKTIVIDYSSPNIAKNFHIGHLRTTVIGNALYNIFNTIGYQSYGINYLGDWGTQFGKLIVAYRRWSSREAVEAGGIDELNRIYVKFHDEADLDPALNDEARLWLVKMQNQEEEAISIWKWFCDISLVEFNKIYDRLKVSFDSWKGESFYNDKMDAVVDELKTKELLVESDGAMIVDLEDYKMPPCLILRRDGGTLYPTRDIAAAFYRKKTYDFAKCLYVTALDQNLHFAQWFKVIELMGYPWAKDLVHIPYGLVSMEEGSMSTRSGRVVLMINLLDEAVSRARRIIEDKNPGLENKDEVAEQVGIGAVIFHDLYNGRIKDVVFSWDQMLNFEGETGPYVQYTHARANSVLLKAGETDFAGIDFNHLTDEASFAVARLLDRYPGKIQEAAVKYEPYIVSRHLIDIAQAFNKFYHDNSILNAPPEVMKARLLLTHSVRAVLRSGLGLLGIAAPDKM